MAPTSRPEGGKRFTSAQDIAQIGSGYADLDNARVAVVADGTAFVTLEDANGPHAGNSEPLAAEYARLRFAHPPAVEVPLSRRVER